MSLYTVPELITKLEDMDFDDCQLADAQAVYEAAEALKRLQKERASAVDRLIPLGLEIERLQAENQRLHHRCAAPAYLHYGHYLVQRTSESVQADIEACESALTALRAELRALPQSANLNPPK